MRFIIGRICGGRGRDTPFHVGDADAVEYAVFRGIVLVILEISRHHFLRCEIMSTE